MASCSYPRPIINIQNNKRIEYGGYLAWVDNETAPEVSTVALVSHAKGNQEHALVCHIVWRRLSTRSQVVTCAS